MTVIVHFHDLFNKNKYLKYAQIFFFWLQQLYVQVIFVSQISLLQDEILPFLNNVSPFKTTSSTT